MKTYNDYLEYVKAKVKKNGQAFYTSDEYKELYPIMKRLYEEEGHAARRAAKLKRARQIRKQIEEDTLKYGVPVGLFMS